MTSYTLSTAYCTERYEYPQIYPLICVAWCPSGHVLSSAREALRSREDNKPLYGWLQLASAEPKL